MPRDRRLDVLRGGLILTVVAGHLLETHGGSGWDDPPQRALLTLIYAVHMPAFVFLTGVNAKTDRIGVRVARLAAVLVVFQTLYLAFRWVLGDPEAEWFFPYWVLWYVMAMIWWQALMPLIARFRTTALLASVGISLAAGVLDLHGNWFAYSRTAVFLPFFVAGFLWGKQALRTLPTVPGAVKATAVILFLLGTMTVYGLGGDPHWLFGNWGYGQLGSANLPGAIGRASVSVLAAVGVCALLMLAPARMPALEKPGRHSLAVFLFHVFAVEIYAVTLGPASARLPAAVAAVMALAVAIGLTALFSAAPFERACRSVLRIPDALSERRAMRSEHRSTGEFPSTGVVLHNEDIRRPTASPTDSP
jgi:fucose 4-O-acetylase-like acetyltransferase